jgi:LPXTG-site transpeptidase (sortase) family protein
MSNVKKPKKKLYKATRIPSNLPLTTNKPDTKRERIGKLLVGIGTILIILAFGILFTVTSPVLFHELTYQFGSHKPVRVESVSSQTNNVVDVIVPKDPNAGIVIPKIRANASIVLNVDPYNEKAYQQALTKGVAHAKTSAYPGQIGNVFLFSHSSQDFFTANRYNSIFYLLTKLEQDDEIYLFYQGKPYMYTVTGHTIVEPNAVSLMTKKAENKELTLMTCWPPGTTLKRYIVTAKIK